MLKVIFLGIVEGITEWLPISSTGHMLLVDEFIRLDMTDSFKEMFFVVIQLGAILAVVLLFWKKMFPFPFILIENWNKKRKVRVESLNDITYQTAFLIGLFQVLAIIPGTSRSGATIIGALLIGVSRVAAAEFTFFLAVPVMFGWSLIKLIKFGIAFSAQELCVLGLGCVVAFAVSVVVIRFLMGYIKKHDFKVFGWYRIILGAIVLGYFAL